MIRLTPESNYVHFHKLTMKEAQLFRHLDTMQKNIDGICLPCKARVLEQENLAQPTSSKILEP